MNLDELEKSGLIFYRTIVGSHAYKTNVPESDVDEKGFYWVNPAEYLTLNPPNTQDDGQISDATNDTSFYSLYKLFDLIKDANPNMIELLWMPERCVNIYNKEMMDILMDNRDIFISRQAYHSHCGYARNQIKKAKGSNKKVHNPQPEERPVKEDFCHLILSNTINPFEGLTYMEQKKLEKSLIKGNKFPFRPTPLNETDIDLSKHHVASLEHLPNTYRLYEYGEEAKGVFRGDDMLVTESIPKEHEWAKNRGLLIYNKNDYDKAVKAWNSYWEWVNKRNDARWIDQEKGLVDYDAKNMMHCVRLMMSSEGILTTGNPTVEIEGESNDLLMKIRRGEFEYGDLMTHISVLEKRLKHLYNISNLPEKADMEKIEKVYKKIMEVGSNVYS